MGSALFDLKKLLPPALGLPHLLHDQLVQLLAHQAAGQAEEQAVGHKLGAFI